MRRRGSVADAMAEISATQGHDPVFDVRPWAQPSPFPCVDARADATLLPLAGRDASTFKMGGSPVLRYAAVFATLISCLWPAAPAYASSSASSGAEVSLISHPVGWAALAIFLVAYIAVMAEEHLKLQKSKPVLLAAGLIWMVIGGYYAVHGDTTTAGTALRHHLLEFAELFLFLLAAMTFINTMDDRGVWAVMRSRILRLGLTFRALFWVTGGLAFILSPVLDNLTTALVLGAIIVSVGRTAPAFVPLACINVVVAANAGGAFSPFGDITTLMVWQKGVIAFGEFFALLVPALVNWVVPAFLMARAVPLERPAPEQESALMADGGTMVVGIFALTIVIAILGHSLLHLPPVLGMMFGLACLKIYGYVLEHRERKGSMGLVNEADDVFASGKLVSANGQGAFDSYRQLERAEWDTLMFFYGVILAVGGLGTLGYLSWLSGTLYGDWGPTVANILIGPLSAFVDNIPVMFAVLAMNPDMSHGQWLLVTLTAGVGGSLLSIGSAAGVALMGQTKGVYGFMQHLRWSWAIALGYVLSIVAHFTVNRHLF